MPAGFLKPNEYVRALSEPIATGNMHFRTRQRSAKIPMIYPDKTFMTMSSFARGKLKKWG